MVASTFRVLWFFTRCRVPPSPRMPGAKPRRRQRRRWITNRDRPILGSRPGDTQAFRLPRLQKSRFCARNDSAANRAIAASGTVAVRPVLGLACILTPTPVSVIAAADFGGVTGRDGSWSSSSHILLEHEREVAAFCTAGVVLS
jgi:hypothetical protein